MEKAFRALQAIEVDIDPGTVNPHLILLEQVQRAYLMTHACRAMLLSLGEEDLALIGLNPQVIGLGEGVTVPERPEGAGHRGARALAYFDLYESWMDKSVKFAAVAIKAGVEERMVTLAEGQANLIADTIRYALLGVGLGEDLVMQALRLATHKLRTSSLDAPKLVGSGS